MEYALIFPYLITFLPILLLIVYSLLPGKIRRFPNTTAFGSVVLMIVLVYAIGEFPPELSFDKEVYTRIYFGTLNYGIDYGSRDYGWIAYNILCGKIFGNNVDLFFLVTSIIYVGAYYLLAIKLFRKNVIGYFFVMCTGCIGFSAYGTNTIRAGFALAFLLLCLTLSQKRWLQVVLAIIALSMHKSMLIPIVAYIAAKTVKETKIVFVIWGLCLIFSALNLDLGIFFESVGFVDERVESYAESINSWEGEYEKGFRLDFLIYSIVPILIYLYYILKKKIDDKFYSLILMAYLLANAVWLLAIRMSRSDRLAYLSWFLIPILTLYPVLKYPNKFKYPLRTVLVIMYIFMGVRLYLSLRHS